MRAWPTAWPSTLPSYRASTTPNGKRPLRHLAYNIYHSTSTQDTHSMTSAPNIPGPHANSQMLTAGVPLKEATAAMLMVHGRGATAEDILGLADPLDIGNFAYVAPQAVG